MRAIDSLLADLTTRDIRLWADEGRLRLLNFVLPIGSQRERLEVQEQLQVFSPDGGGSMISRIAVGVLVMPMGRYSAGWCGSGWPGIS